MSFKRIQQLIKRHFFLSCKTLINTIDIILALFFEGKVCMIEIAGTRFRHPCCHPWAVSQDKFSFFRCSGGRQMPDMGT